MDLAQALQIFVVETRGGCFRAYLANGRELVKSSRTPFLDAARVLLAEGVDPATRLTMLRGSTESLSAPIGEAAKLKVKETEVYGPRFEPWTPLTEDKKHRLRSTLDRTGDKTDEG
jgi:hypothetical protein